MIISDHTLSIGIPILSLQMINNNTIFNRFPIAACFLCDQTLKRSPFSCFCEACEHDLPSPLSSLNKRCIQCAISLPSATSSTQPTPPSPAVKIDTNSLRCADCLKQPPRFDRCSAAFPYLHPLDYLIKSFKKQRQYHVGRWLTQQLIEIINDDYFEPLQNSISTDIQSKKPANTLKHWPELIIPTPTSRQKAWQRGFNPAALIAQELSKQLNIENFDALAQKQKSAEQKSLNRHQRRINLSQLFSVNEAALKRLRGKHVALVDDVMTTGSTAEALSGILKSAGASRVDLWVLARTPSRISQ